MLHLLRLAIWTAGIVATILFGLRFFGYEANWHYFEEQKSRCEDMLSSCRGTLFRKGVDGVRNECRWNCIAPGMLIRKQTSE